MKFSHINTREIHPAYRAVSLSGPARLPYKQALSAKYWSDDVSRQSYIIITIFQYFLKIQNSSSQGRKYLIKNARRISMFQGKAVLEVLHELEF